MFFIFLFIALLHITTADDSCVLGNGNYLKSEWKPNLSEFMGRWYSAYVYPKGCLPTMRCYTVDYYTCDDGMFHASTVFMVSEGKRMEIEGKIKFKKNVMNVQYKQLDNIHESFHFIAGEPETFQIFGGCANMYGGKPLAWIGFRNPSPTDKELNAAKKALEENGLNFSDFEDFCENKEEYELKVQKEEL